MLKQGQALFVIDRVRLTNTLKQAGAAVARSQAVLNAAQRENKRFLSINGIAARKDLDDKRSSVEEA
ncbi:hypothetical protein [Shewanella vesiculosa]